MIFYFPSGAGAPPDYPDVVHVEDGVTFGYGAFTGTLGILSAETVATAVWNRLLVDHTTPGSFGVYVKKLLTVGKFLGLK